MQSWGLRHKRPRSTGLGLRRPAQMTAQRLACPLQPSSQYSLPIVPWHGSQRSLAECLRSGLQEHSPLLK